MSLLRPHDQSAAAALAAIPFTNPFLEERIELERRALGAGYVGVGPVLRARPGAREESFPELQALRDRSEALLAAMRGRIDQGHEATSDELLLYEDLALFVLYLRSSPRFEPMVGAHARPGDSPSLQGLWDKFEGDFHQLFRPLGRPRPSDLRPALLFAGFFQVERAFTHVFDKIAGGSMPAARLRAAVWESIFSCDMRRYLRVLHERMPDLPTLIVGPSGSGKELVARAIGMSGFIPFNTRTFQFESNWSDLYAPVNLAALAPGLIESELFGHVKGAFPGAIDRRGWLEKCGPHGAVFLDEIGELDGSIQVKLLRVLETRHFERVGSTKTRRFGGKVIAATNRDLAAEMEAGRFRHDLYYRLCADQVATPSLAEQLADRPEDLPDLVRFIARDTLLRGPAGGDGSSHAGAAVEEVERLTAQVVEWIGRELGPTYAWPGNFRELGQCVRNVMIRGRYRPSSRGRGGAEGHGPIEEFLRAARDVNLTADELCDRYYAMALARSGGNFRAAGRRVHRDWRVVRDRHDRLLFDQLQSAGIAQGR
jgi:DNA-binding NtrC family response regulator